MRCNSLVVAFAVCLATTQPAFAKQVVMLSDWDEARSVMAHGDFLSKVRVWKKTGKQMQVKGRLLEVTSTGLRIALYRSETFIGQDELHWIRLVPRKGSSRRNRNLAAAFAAPAGIGACIVTYVFGCLAVGGCKESGPSAVGLVGIFGSMIAVPVALYRLGRRADRGSVLIVLRETAATASPDGRHAESQ